MPDRTTARRTVLEGVAAGWSGALFGSGIGVVSELSEWLESRAVTVGTGLERRRPATQEVTVVPESTVLFEAEPPREFEPGDVEWDGDGEPGGRGAPLALDYEYAAGVPAAFRTFESTGTHEVTAIDPDSGELRADWTVRVDDDGALAPTVDLSVDPGEDERIGVDDTVELTATASTRDGRLDRLIWVEGQNMTVPEVSDLEGEQDSVTLAPERPGWMSAGYPTTAIAVSEIGLLSEPASVDGPEIRPPLAIEIVETNDPVPAGGTLEVVAEVENVGDMMMVGDTTQELEFVVGEDPTVVDAATVAVDWPETERVTFAFETYPVEHDDRFPVRVVGADDADERIVEVFARDATGLDVSIQGTNAPVDAGDRLEVTARVENVGNQPISRDVELVVGHDPQLVDSVSVALEAGERGTVSLGYETYPAAQTTAFPVVVDTGDDADERTIRVIGTGD
ncbi:CARDB domain-containing protein [Natrarchaeobius chitinivorans]|uniref:CARDB domain-containing protein n=1 Tax=Natrarchaeobius chitinivorans TaxID=1679083 RepID=A0A3N6MY66_NATCH|nr:CARDB domain-containing protein [Natrarchaeobius chitinivorans]RQG90502.1 hypothetical protein EA473_20955 [Natrarchaeobius chitinivorans]